jgi:hypothetical protein
MKLDEDKVYMKIVELEEIYNFVTHFCLNTSLGQNHSNNVLSPYGNLGLSFYKLFINISNLFAVFDRRYNIFMNLILF